MEFYRELAAMRCFTRKELVEIAGSEASAAWMIGKYLEKGYIERVRRDLYAVISLETGQPIPNRYQIASHVADDAYISHHSAFEYYGYANQVYYEVYAASKRRVRPFSYDGIDYQFVAYRGPKGLIEMDNGVRVTSLERTVVDSIADFTKIGGMEELLRCLLLVPTLSYEKLLEFLELYECGKLYQKTGYILEFFREDMGLPGAFFEECEKHISGSRTYLFAKRDDFIYHRRWRLFAPGNIRTFIDKGVNNYDAV
ncbi:MAG TPA: transcriptional regulator [Candidatus Eisenbergiella merdavium]|uniref:Transcriptional regulator n=1 Tax=Candidatus Eisenbergiella merdavium TaxID=2838551 RepID=A0A9D2ST53_9FIRM|nr:transcriptional regulator [Candidatus Eisenbergiella merdavium]